MAMLSDTCTMYFGNSKGEKRQFMFGRIDRRTFLSMWEKQGMSTDWRLMKIVDHDYYTAQDAMADLLEK